MLFHVQNVVVVVQINNMDNSVLPLTQEELNSLTSDLAHDLVRGDPKYQQFCEGRQFQSIDFTLYPGYQATINFIVEKEKQQIAQ
jgi:hypothetical protein